MSIGLHAMGKLYLISEKTAVKEGMIEDNKITQRQTDRQTDYCAECQKDRWTNEGANITKKN